MESKSYILRFLFFDRTFRTLILASILILMMGSSRPEESRGLYPSTYWARKAGWEKCADMVLAGDSRTLVGLSPNVMRKYFPDTRIYNYGFGAVWFSDKYLKRAKGLLDPDSEDKTIILGISPHALLKQDMKTGQFFKLSSMSDRERFVHIYFGVLIEFFNPLSFKDALKGIFPSLEEIHTEKTLYPDGWIAVHKEPVSMKKSLVSYEKYYESQKADSDVIENIMRFVKECVSEGIKIYGFIPPTCRMMYELERSVSGLDEEGFISGFEASGGMWIDTDTAGYDSFDGSHLQDDAAIEFTHDLCKKMIQMDKEIAREGSLAK